MVNFKLLQNFVSIFDEEVLVRVENFHVYYQTGHYSTFYKNQSCFYSTFLRGKNGLWHCHG